MNSLAPACTRRWKLRFLLVHGLALLSLGCAAGPHVEQKWGMDSSERSCLPRQSDEPSLAQGEKPASPTSQIWIHAQASTTDLEERIAELIPRQLAAQKNRPVGAAGKATYRVTRGRPRLKVRRDKLELRVPIRANISVCKPLGIGCLRYGRCSPSFEAKFALGTQPKDGYHIEAPRGSIGTTKRCVIGIDVTNRIEGIARKEVRQVESTIRQQWPDSQFLAERAWQKVGRPLALQNDACVGWHPLGVQYVALRTQPEEERNIDSKSPSKTRRDLNLRMSVGLSGQLKPLDSCQETPGAFPLPSPQRLQKAASRSTVWIPELMDFRQVLTRLKASVEGNWHPSGAGDLKILKLKLSGTQFALQLQLEGDLCGTTWVRGHFKQHDHEERIVLSDVSIEGTAPSENQTPTERQRSQAETLLVQHLEMKGAIALDRSAWLNLKRLHSESSILTAALAQEVQLHVEDFELGEAIVFGSDQGLHLSHPVSAQLTVKALPQLKQTRK